MVHVKKCPLGKRGRPSTEFYKDGKPQVYCHGYIDKMTDDPLKECKACADYVDKAQSDLVGSRCVGQTSNENQMRGGAECNY